MKPAARLLASACAAVLLFGAAPGLAQVGTPALDRVLTPVPAPRDVAYPGVITLEMDATDIDRRIVSVKQTIPVAGPGPLILLYPQWIPGNHGPVGPVDDLGDLRITANGQPLRWVRNTVDTNAYQVEVPAGAASVEVSFKWLTPIDGAQGRIVITDEMLNIQWEKALLYPAGYYSRQITFQPTLRLPAGWQYGTALDTRSFQNGVASFAPVTLEHFADSPVFAGAHYRQIDLDPGGRSPVRLNIVADDADMLAATDEHIELHRNLVDQADRLYGARHFNHYDFLLAVSDDLGGIGLEHHRSSENSVDTDYFTDAASTLADRDLLGHEYTHSWNGKWRRPADQLTPTLNEPLQNSLLWVYEGQTQYWGLILTARAGLMTKQQALDVFANTAATYAADNPGRSWRAMQDTTNDPIIAQRRPQPWGSFQRSEDYYREGAMIWLDADTLIREQTNGRKSLDDFARAFFGVQDGSWDPAPYTFADVTSTLNGVQPNDWAAFLRTRLDAVGANAPTPNGGIERGGYRLVWRETPNDYSKALNKELDRVDFAYSLGLSLNPANRVTAVRWGSPAFDAGLTSGWEVVAVNGRAASADAISEAITASKGNTTPIEMMLKKGDRFRTIAFDYHGGLRYPHLERIAGTPDRLGEILSPRRR
ncbi:MULTISPECIES: M61 family metallopeptidase [unclassified Brevundimonas]|uniref:M61 family metallopeptidase n=1 Tax=unclassified Brevundimonas TaxID=2622653 RepID=UPI000701CA37|nr:MULTISPECIES: M61 family metallopeptidase [unclassified Brevundimonas]KQY84450.1 peptidase M61 [Brevundimonas sp. Root1423]KRA19777.1 peptidase M61 [Brevundimonas sp. Root608]